MSVSEMARGVHEEELASANAGGASGKEVVRKHGPAMPADLAHELSDDDFYRLVAWARLYSTERVGLDVPRRAAPRRSTHRGCWSSIPNVL